MTRPAKAGRNTSAPCQLQRVVLRRHDLPNDHDLAKDERELQGPPIPTVATGAAIVADNEERTNGNR